MDSYDKVIGEYELVLAKYKANKNEKVDGKVFSYSFNDDKAIIPLLNALVDMYKYEIHTYLMWDYDSEKEKVIRKYIKNIIVSIMPVLEYKIKYLTGRLEYIEKRPYKHQLNMATQKEEFQNNRLTYLDLYHKYLLLCAFRSYRHFCIAMQKVFNFTLWSDTEEIESGYFYYANKLILDKDVNFMERQLPTGFGKTIGNCFMIAYIFGYNYDSDVFYVCGNDKFTDDVFNNVLKLMTSEEYAKIFPYYSQFNGERDLMFSYCKSNELKFAIYGSKKATSLRIATKLSDTNGVRAQYLFLDDITQRRDMANLAAHEKDIHAFTHEWFERNYSRYNFKIIASGTTYSMFDLLSHLKNVFNYDNAIVSKQNKYTKIANADFICPNKIACFVCVPLLDADTDESTYPKKISTENARKKRETNYEEYMAMDNQTPLPPTENPFYYNNLREYATIPDIGTLGRTDCCNAALDPKRSGKDFVSMPIGIETEEGHYIIDWLYDQRPMKECYDDIVAKIIQHKITRLYVERNTDEGIKPFLDKLLREKGYYSCTIEDVYSTLPKDRRIAEAESDIKTNIIFPKFNMYARSSPFGKALESLYTYSYVHKVPHDDAPDSIAMYAKKFVMKNIKTYGTCSTFSR